MGFRKWEEEDFELAFTLWGNEEVTKLIISNNQISKGDVQELLSKEIENQKNYNIQYWPLFLLTTNEFIGCCGLRPYDLVKNIYEIGAHILPKHWRNGYALEASRTVIDFSFNFLKFSALFAGHNPKNTASKNLM